MLVLYRISRWFYSHKIPIIPQLFQALIFLFFNSKLTSHSIIGKGSYFVCRGISVVLIPGTKIGQHCVLGLRFSTVRKFPYKDVPILGNNVWCGPNVVIAGPVIIGENVIIAANSFVDKSVPSGAIVGGSPAKIIGWRNKLNYKIEENPKDKEGTMPYLEDNSL